MCIFIVFVNIFKVVGLLGALVAGILAEGQRLNILRTINLDNGRLSGVLLVRNLFCAVYILVVSVLFKAIVKCLLYAMFDSVDVFKEMACRFPVIRVFVCFVLVFMIRALFSRLAVGRVGGRSLMRRIGRLWLEVILWC